MPPIVITMPLLQNPNAGILHLYFNRYACQQYWVENPLFYFAGRQYQAAPSLQKLQVLVTFARNGWAGVGVSNPLPPLNLQDGALDPAEEAVNAGGAVTGDELDDALDGDYGIGPLISEHVEAYNQANAGGIYQAQAGALSPTIQPAIYAYQRTFVDLAQALRAAGLNERAVGIPYVTG